MEGHELVFDRILSFVMPSAERQKRTGALLGLPGLLFYGVGVIVGAGIYSIIGAATQYAERGVWLSMVIVAIPAFFTGVCYAQLCTMHPHAGGAFMYVSQAFPRRVWIAFGIGTTMIATAGAMAATVAVAFGGYLAGLTGWPPAMGAAVLLLACTGINILGMRESLWATVFCTVVEILGLIAVIFAGFATGDVGTGMFDVRAAGVLAGAAVIFFVFTGFEGLVNLAEDSRKPTRHIPLAIIISLAVTLVLYVLVGLAAVALVEPAHLAKSEAPLFTVAAASHPQLGVALRWIALFSTANTALITLVTTSRMVYGMAREGQLPPVLGRLVPGRHSPWAAALLMLVVSGAFLPLGRVDLIGSVSSLTTLVVFAAVAVALISLRRKGERPTFWDHVDSTAPNSCAGEPASCEVMGMKYRM